MEMRVRRKVIESEAKEEPQIYIKCFGLFLTYAAILNGYTLVVLILSVACSS